MKKELESRHARINDLISRKKLNGVLFFNYHDIENPNLIYATNCSEAGIFVLKKQEPHLYTIGWKNKFSTPIKNTHIERLRQLPKIKGKIGIDRKNISADFYRMLSKLTNANFVDISHEMEIIRSVKSEYEIKTIKTACNIAE